VRGDVGQNRAALQQRGARPDFARIGSIDENCAGHVVVCAPSRVCGGQPAQLSEIGLHRFNWTPGIGDPTLGGWITVVLYFLAMVSCWVTARRCETKERRIWAAISILFLGLGINKQLDLQSALTEFGRVLAYQEGWYDQRQAVQLAFIVVVAAVCACAVITLLIWTYLSPIPTWLALSGTTLVIGFVLIRAASFHHIDRFIGNTVLGATWNWILEMGGISVVLLASYWRRKRRDLAPPRYHDGG